MAPGDRETKAALARIEARAAMLSETGEENSVVIEQRAAESVKTSSAPPPVKWVVVVLNAITDWRKMVVALAIVGLVGYLLLRGALKLP